MATIVLSVAGAAVGGPIGATIGAAIGQQIDAEIFKPRGRQGPRLTDLKIQTSSYGTPVPRLYGRTRVAGTVIWATDLKERRKTSGGKGQPSVTTFSYAASFAVALSSRPISDIGRIWADGKLLRGAGGDFKSALTAFRVYRGDERQSPDPLMAMSLGAGRASAHRGIAYALFEDLQLADFGNRIPSLSFEVIADSGAVTLVDIAADLVPGLRDASPGAAAGALPPLLGYQADGASVGDSLAPLSAIDRAIWREDGEQFVVAASYGSSNVDVDQRLRTTNGRDVERMARRRPDRRRLPDTVAVRYLDPQRDYLSGLQSARTTSESGERRQIDLPAAIEATTAQALAEAMLRDAGRAGEQVRIAIGWDGLGVQPGDLVALAGDSGLWRVESWRWERMAVFLELSPWRVVAASTPGDADPGASVNSADDPAGETRIDIVELPAMPGVQALAPRVFVAATGTGAAWRPAPVLIAQQDGFELVGSPPDAALSGVLATALPASSPHLVDRSHGVAVTLHNPAQSLEPVSLSSLLAGANACLIGDEVVQFMTAEQTGPQTYNLRTLLRGRAGTEHRIAAHASGTRFIMLTEERWLAVPDRLARIGATIDAQTRGIGESDPVSATLRVNGDALRPLSPCWLRLAKGADGAITVRWIRRSRAGWSWNDELDAPIAESLERYRVTIRSAGTIVRQSETAQPQLTYDVAEQTADGFAAAAPGWTVDVAQIGDLAPGHMSTIDLSE